MNYPYLGTSVGHSDEIYGPQVSIFKEKIVKYKQQHVKIILE